MHTLNTIIEELKNVPADRLEDLYSIVFSLREGKGKPGKQAQEILSFAGAFNDMDEKEYNEFKEYTKKTRTELFDRDINV